MATAKTQRVTLFMDPQIAKHARAQAVLEDLSLTALVEKALNRYLPEFLVLRKAETIKGTIS